MCRYLHIPTYIHTYIHTYLPTYLPTYIHTDIPKVHTYPASSHYHTAPVSISTSNPRRHHVVAPTAVEPTPQPPTLLICQARPRPALLHNESALGPAHPPAPRFVFAWRYFFPGGGMPAYPSQLRIGDGLDGESFL
jgi:hypothetical protein